MSDQRHLPNLDAAPCVAAAPLLSPMRRRASHAGNCRRLAGQATEQREGLG